MIKCNNCQAENQDNSLVCTNCGAKLENNQQPTEVNQTQQQQQPFVGQPIPPFQQPYGATANTTGQLVWSILNLVLCCLPLGIVSLVMTIGARNAITKEEFDSKIKNAKTFNIIATVLGAVIAIVTFLLVVILEVSFFNWYY